MTTNYTINNQTALATDFHKIKDLFINNLEVSASVFDDNNLDSNEIIDAFDKDHSHSLDLPDIERTIRKIGYSIFSNIKAILKIHGFNLYNFSNTNDLFSYIEENPFKNISFKDFQTNFASILQDSDSYLYLASRINNTIDLAKFYDIIPDNLKANRSFCIQLISSNHLFIDLIAKQVFDIDEMVIEAIAFAPNIFIYIKPKFRDDERAVTNAINDNCGGLFEYASDRLKNSIPFIENLMLTKNPDLIIEYVGPSVLSNLNFAHFAISINPTYFKYFNICIRNNIELAKKACLDYPANLEWAPFELQNDHEFVSQIIDKDPNVYKWISNELKQDYAFTLKAIKHDGSLLSYAPIKYKNNKDLALQATTNRNGAMNCIGDTLKNDNSFLMDACLNNPMAWFNCPSEFKNNKPFLLKLINSINNQEDLFGFLNELEFDSLLRVPRQIRIDPDIITIFIDNGIDCNHINKLRRIDSLQEELTPEEIPDHLRKNIRFMFDKANEFLSAEYIFNIIKTHAFPTRNIDFKSITKKLQTTYGEVGFWNRTCLLADYCVNDFMLLSAIAPSDKKDLWPEIVRVIHEKNISLPEDMLISEHNFWKGVNKFTKFPARFRSLETLATVIDTQANPADPIDNRPIALCIYPKADYNQAFESYPAIDMLVNNKNFRVVYYEVGTTNKMKQALKQFENKKQIHTLILAGHGTKNIMQLNSPALPLPTLFMPDLVHFSKWDIKNHEFDFLTPLLDPKGQILLFSCSNGSGMESENNLANNVLSIMPQDMRLISTFLQSNIKEMNISDNLQLNIVWHKHSSYEMYAGSQSTLSSRILVNSSTSESETFGPAIAE